MKEQIKTIDFKDIKIFIGIDIHQKNWVITIRTRDTHLRTFSMDPSPEGLYLHLKENYPFACLHRIVHPNR